MQTPTVGETRRGAFWRSRWAAIGAAVAVTLGGGGLVAVQAASGPASSVVTIDPVRILDTRTDVGLPGPFVSAVSQKLAVAGTAAVPVGATGVLLNVTVVTPTAAGFVSVRPGDATGTPSTSSLNFGAGDIVPNAVQVALPTSGANAGQIDITYDAFGQPGPTTEILVDVVGYLVAGGAGTGPAGPPGPQGPAGPQGAPGSGPADGAACTAGSLPGTIVNGHDGDGNVTVKCFRGLVDTLAGGPTGGPDNGVAGAARFNSPRQLAVDAAGNVYVADLSNHQIRKITPAGAVSTLAGSSPDLAEGSLADARFNGPSGVAVGPDGSIYVADRDNHRIRRITPAGVVSTFAGSTQGFQEGVGAGARFSSPSAVAVDGDGNVYVADTNNHRIRKITPAGAVSTLAGSTSGFADGTGGAAQFNDPVGIAVDGAGNVFVADTDNNRIRKITTAGAVSTLAGSTFGFADGTGGAAQFGVPTGVAVDGSGNVFVADLGNERIRRVTSTGVVTTVAGSASGFQDGLGVSAQFRNPAGVAVDAAGNVYVSDRGNDRIRTVN